MSFLVIDIGTSHCRATIVSGKGELVSQSRAPVALNRIPPSFVEVDTDHIWQQVNKVIRSEVMKHPDSMFEAMGVSAMLGYVFLDKENCPLRPAIIWMDNRAAAQVEEILQSFTEEELYQRTGRKISPELLAPKLRWLAKNEPDTARRLHTVIGLKDEIVRRLTGVVQTDFAHLNYTLFYNVHKGDLDSDILKALGINPSLFPAPLLATEIAGFVSETVAEETGLTTGTPVIAGSSDGTTAMYGGGVLEEGRAVLVSGTTDVLMMSSPSPPNDASHSLSVNNGMVPGTYLAGGAMGLTGGTLQWMEGLLHESVDLLEERLARLKPGSNGLLFFPGLTGERAPYWNDFLTGAMVGLTLEHRAEHIFRAIMEGSSFRIMRLLQVLRENALSPTAINAVGGCARMDVWNQIRADVTGLEVIKLSEIEATSLGTALFCRAGIDKSKSLREAARDWIKAAKRYLPDTHATDEYRVVAQLFHDYMEATRDIYKGLNGLISHSAT